MAIEVRSYRSKQTITEHAIARAQDKAKRGVPPPTPKRDSRSVSRKSYPPMTFEQYVEKGIIKVKAARQAQASS